MIFPILPALFALVLPVLPTAEKFSTPEPADAHAAAAAATTPAANAAFFFGFVFLDFEGNAGEGLLPGNEVGGGTPVAPGAAGSDAFGRKFFLIYNRWTNVLRYGFFFTGLEGGLFDAASGIHFHNGAPGNSPFDETGPIAFNLNSGADPAVNVFTPMIAVDGSRSRGIVIGRATLTQQQEVDLLAGRYYLNIHSGGFNGGELRGNLVR